jgi:hypothetical protein
VKIRNNPRFIQNSLLFDLSTYWRELADWINGLESRPNKWSAAQSGDFYQLLSSSSSISLNLELSNNFNHTLTENTTLSAPSNPSPGQSGVIHLTQHASSPKTLGYNAFWKFSGGSIPTLTTTNSAIDVLSYVVNPSGTSATCVLVKDVK